MGGIEAEHEVFVHPLHIVETYKRSIWAFPYLQNARCVSVLVL